MASYLCQHSSVTAWTCSGCCWTGAAERSRAHSPSIWGPVTIGLDSCVLHDDEEWIPGEGDELDIRVEAGMLVHSSKPTSVSRVKSIDPWDVLASGLR